MFSQIMASERSSRQTIARQNSLDRLLQKRVNSFPRDCAAVKPSRSASVILGGESKRSMSSSPGQCSVSSALQLSQFFANYSSYLPQKVRVERGYYGCNNRLTISAGEILGVFSIKTATVVSVMVGGNAFFIPLNSNLKFSILHQLHPYETLDATKGIIYNGVSLLAEATPRPLVVCCLKSDPNNGLVEANEVLILKTSDQRKTNSLRVFSTLQRRELDLPMDLSATFSTQPDLIPLYLEDLISLVPIPLPCFTVISGVSDIPAVLHQIMTIVKITTESTLLCSSLETLQLFDIPIELPGVEISVLPLDSEAERKELSDSARKVIEHFNPCLVQSLSDAGSRVTSETQKFLYSHIRPGCEKSGISLLGFSTKENHSSIDFFKLENDTSLQTNTTSDIRHMTSRSSLPSVQPLGAIEKTEDDDTSRALDSATKFQYTDLNEHGIPKFSFPDVDDLSPSYSTIQEASIHNARDSLPLKTAPLIGTSILHQEEDVFISLETLAVRYSEKLPASIQIHDGSYSDKLIQVSKFDLFDVHFITNQDVILFKDSENGIRTLPLTAKYTFGMLPCSGSGSLEFETVKDILNHSCLPAVICARRAFKGSNSRSSIDMDEVLIVQKANRFTKWLKVYSPTNGLKKKLPAKCNGHFTTSPNNIQLPIQTIIQHLSHLLPAKMLLFSPGPPPREVTVLGYHCKDHVIVSDVNYRPTELAHLKSIPINAPLTVLVKDYSNKSTISNIETYCRLQNRHMDGAKNTEHEAIEHTTKDDYIDLNPSFAALVKATTDSTFKKNRQRPHSYESYTSMLCQESKGFTIETVQAPDSPKADDYTYVESKRAFVTPKQHPLVFNSPTSFTEMDSVENASKERNRAFLATLSEDQVLALLKSMGLEIYQEMFVKEKVTGDIFSNLDDGILEKELGIQNRLHRLRLLKIIRGETEVPCCQAVH